MIKQSNENESINKLGLYDIFVTVMGGFIT